MSFIVAWVYHIRIIYECALAFCNTANSGIQFLSLGH